MARRPDDKDTPPLADGGVEMGSRSVGIW